MYRHRLRACPWCGGTLTERSVSLEGATSVVELCAGCGGAYFDFSDGTPAALARALDGLEPPAESSRARSGTMACPVCGVTLKEHASLEQVYRCRRCCAVFATRRGLEHLGGVSSPGGVRTTTRRPEALPPPAIPEEWALRRLPPKGRPGARTTRTKVPFGRKVCRSCGEVSFERLLLCPDCSEEGWWRQ